MTEEAIDRIKKKQRRTDNMPAMRSSYREFYDKPGFKLRELGTEIDEEVSVRFLF